MTLVYKISIARSFLFLLQTRPSCAPLFYLCDSRIKRWKWVRRCFRDASSKIASLFGLLCTQYGLIALGIHIGRLIQYVPSHRLEPNLHSSTPGLYDLFLQKPNWDGHITGYTTIEVKNTLLGATHIRYRSSGVETTRKCSTGYPILL